MARVEGRSDGGESGEEGQSGKNGWEHSVEEVRKWCTSVKEVVRKR